MVVRGQSLVTYKDQKTCKSSPEQLYKGESPLDLKGAAIAVANDYTKKKHVFRVKLVFIFVFLVVYILNFKYQNLLFFSLPNRTQSGSDFLFQAKDDAEMNEWVSILNQAAQGASVAGSSRAQTLPAPSQAETKKRSFFTLKKK